MYTCSSTFHSHSYAQSSDSHLDHFWIPSASSRSLSTFFSTWILNRSSTGRRPRAAAEVTRRGRGLAAAPAGTANNSGAGVLELSHVELLECRGMKEEEEEEGEQRREHWSDSIADMMITTQEWQSLVQT